MLKWLKTYSLTQDFMRRTLVLLIFTVVQGHSLLRSTLYVDLRSCRSGEPGSNDSKTYESPVNRCYNPRHIFDDDTQWGLIDIFDTCVLNGNGTIMVNRTFYNSTDSSCSGPPDSGFQLLPTSYCIGPFGTPRPWGVLQCPY